MSIRQLWLWGRIVAGIGLGIGIFWYVIQGVDFGALASQLAKFNWALMIPVFALVVMSAVVRAYRWRLLFHGGAPSLSLLFFVENTGLGLNSVAPIRVIAEPIQFGYLALREGYDRGVVLASIILGRVSDLAVTLGCIAIGFAIFPPHGAEILTWIVLGLTAVVIFVAVGSLFTHRFAWFDQFPIVRTYTAAWRELVGQPKKLALVGGVTLAQWLLLGAAAFLVFNNKGVDIAGNSQLWQTFGVIYVVMLGTMTLGSLIPGLPSGIGPFEAAAVAFLGFYGVAKEPALAFGLLIHLGFFVPPIVIAVITLIMFGPPWSTRHRVRRIRRERREARRAAAANREAQRAGL